MPDDMQRPGSIFVAGKNIESTFQKNTSKRYLFCNVFFGLVFFHSWSCKLERPKSVTPLSVLEVSTCSLTLSLIVSIIFLSGGPGRQQRDNNFSYSIV